MSRITLTVIIAAAVAAAGFGLAACGSSQDLGSQAIDAANARGSAADAQAEIEGKAEVTSETVVEVDTDVAAATEIAQPADADFAAQSALLTAQRASAAAYDAYTDALSGDYDTVAVDEAAAGMTAADTAVTIAETAQMQTEAAYDKAVDAAGAGSYGSPYYELISAKMSTDMAYSSMGIGASADPAKIAAQDAQLAQIMTEWADAKAAAGVLA